MGISGDSMGIVIMVGVIALALSQKRWNWRFLTAFFIFNLNIVGLAFSSFAKNHSPNTHMWSNAIIHLLIWPLPLFLFSLFNKKQRLLIIALAWLSFVSLATCGKIWWEFCSHIFSILGDIRQFSLLVMIFDWLLCSLIFPLVNLAALYAQLKLRVGMAGNEPVPTWRKVVTGVVCFGTVTFYLYYSKNLHWAFRLAERLLRPFTGLE